MGKSPRSAKGAPGAYPTPRILPAGESAVVVELGDAIDPGLNESVRALDEALRAEPFEGYVEAVPTYRSLLVFLDPRVAGLEAVRAHLRELGPGASAKPRRRPRKRVPVVYDGEDLDEVAARLGLGRSDVVELHSGREYLVYMVGFTPGFAYMGTTDERLALGRRETPRVRVPAGSVAVAMGQTGIYPQATPGGWHLLGRAEHRALFDPERDPPSYFLPGDRVRFEPADELAELPDRPEARPSLAAEHREAGPAALEIEEAGLLTTVQDEGRVGYQRYGVPVSGAADVPALRAANRLVGNAPGAAAIECTVTGPRIRCLRPTLAAVTGADLGAVVEREDLGTWAPPAWSSFFLRAGNVLRFAGRRSGARAYVAFAGGIHVPPVLGSRSTYLVAGLGGHEGRALRDGDRLVLGSGRTGGDAAPTGPVLAGRRWPANDDPAARSGEIRVVWGPQDDSFVPRERERLVSSEYVVRDSSDRMGARLDGAPIRHRGSGEIVSDGMMLGAIQVPPSGQPIVMLADRATTGGYPKIATVVSVDVARLAQLLPSEAVRFRAVTLEEARNLHAAALAEESRSARGLGL